MEPVDIQKLKIFKNHLTTKDRIFCVEQVCLDVLGRSKIESIDTIHENLKYSN